MWDGEYESAIGTGYAESSLGLLGIHCEGCPVWFKCDIVQATGWEERV